MWLNERPKTSKTASVLKWIKTNKVLKELYLIGQYNTIYCDNLPKPSILSCIVLLNSILFKPCLFRYVIQYYNYYKCICCISRFTPVMISEKQITTWWILLLWQGWKEGNALFNDALNTLNLRKEGIKDIFNLKMYSTHFIYDYMASEI